MIYVVSSTCTVWTPYKVLPYPKLTDGKLANHRLQQSKSVQNPHMSHSINTVAIRRKKQEEAAIEILQSPKFNVNHFLKKVWKSPQCMPLIQHPWYWRFAQLLIKKRDKGANQTSHGIKWNSLHHAIILYSKW